MSSPEQQPDRQDGLEKREREAQVAAATEILKELGVDGTDRMRLKNFTDRMARVAGLRGDRAVDFARALDGKIISGAE